MHPRVKYHSESEKDWTTIKDPVGSLKYDGASFFMEVQSDGSLKYFSRKKSVKGHYPERSIQLPHLSDVKMPQYAGNTYVVELIHSGHKKGTVESHGKLSGILNSLPPKSIETQLQTGPVRAVLHGIINPKFSTYKDTLLHLKEVETAFGKPDLLFTIDPVITVSGIQNLIGKARREGREGVIVTSLSEPESSNTRIKIKNFGTWNLRITKILQEKDINGNPKPSMGAVVCVDRSGRVVCDVGSGFSRADRLDAWNHPENWINDLIQVKSMGSSGPGTRLRHPTYNGRADGELDLVE